MSVDASDGSIGKALVFTNVIELFSDSHNTELQYMIYTYFTFNVNYDQ